MIFKVDEGFYDFRFWGLAAETAEILRAYDDEHGTSHCEEVADSAEEKFNEGEDCTATDINNWLAYDVPNDADAPWAEVFTE